MVCQPTSGCPKKRQQPASGRSEEKPRSAVNMVRTAEYLLYF